MTDRQVQIGGTSKGIRFQLSVKWGKYPILARRVQLTVGKFAVIDAEWSAESEAKVCDAIGAILGDSDPELMAYLLRGLSEVKS